MKVMAINSSLRGGGQSRTELMLTHLVKGMREAGAEVEVVNLRKKKIKNCIGCFTCMTKTPGKCVINDDMTDELLPKWLESDLVVYATPLFHHTVNAPMKTFLERTWPTMLPFFEKRNDGRWHHPWRHKPPAAVILSVCGFFEGSAFGALSHYANFLWGKNLIAEIYRPAAMNMTFPGLEDIRDDILEAIRQSGRELIESRKISPKTMARITQPLGDLDTTAEFATLFWKTCIAEGITPRTFEQKGIIPRPDSIESFMKTISIGFNPQAAGDIQAILQFTFSGEVEGSCYFTIEKGTIVATLGTTEKPDLTIDTPFEVWMDIITGKADGQQMFMEGKYRAEGNISLMRVFDQEAESQEEKITKEDTMEVKKMDKQRLTCREIISGMPTAFNAEAAGDLVAIIYYKVTGEEPGDYYLEIANGICTFHEGTPSSPTLTIETPSEVWVSISLGELDGQKAFMEQKYKTSGDIGLLMKLSSLFSSD
ncbi:MAG: SCP2 sterol-binding domain-containing protein [Candidatus Sifarchaeia archaeon]|jgi:multimeric flavodoxin WrbA/putative sterol carrier protein